jgi:hypothetical protein
MSVIDTFGSPISKRAEIPIEWLSVSIAFYEILLNLRADGFQDIPEMPNYWEILEYRVLGL